MIQRERKIRSTKRKIRKAKNFNYKQIVTFELILLGQRKITIVKKKTRLKMYRKKAKMINKRLSTLTLA